MVWTLRVPFQNVKKFITLRPPAALFGLCIGSFAIVTLSLAFYVKHTSSPLKNPDEKVFKNSYIIYIFGINSNFFSNPGLE